MTCVEFEMLNANEGGRDWFPFWRWWRDGFLDRRRDLVPRPIQL